jgi:hypothetical protein
METLQEQESTPNVHLYVSASHMHLIGADQNYPFLHIAAAFHLDVH